MYDCTTVKSPQYLMQSRSQHRHQEAVVNVTQQLGSNGGMSNLKKRESVIHPSPMLGSVCLQYLGDSTAEVKGVQEVDQSWNLRKVKVVS